MPYKYSIHHLECILGLIIYFVSKRTIGTILATIPNTAAKARVYNSPKRDKSAVLNFSFVACGYPT